MDVQEKEKEKVLKQLIADYKIVFGSEQGERVLEDLKKRCHFYASTHVKDNSHESAFYEGQRAAILWIDNVTKHKEK